MKNMRKYAGAVLALVMAVLLVSFSLLPSLAQDEVITTRDTPPDASKVDVEEVVSGLTYPLLVVDPGDDSGRLFVLQQAGQIMIVKEGSLVATPFLDLSDTVSQDVLAGYSERGLLGLAFHPDFKDNGELFVNYTDQDGNTHIVRYSVSSTNPDQVDLSSAKELLVLKQPFPNHNGGHLEFGPDGYLYVSVGDGGAANDPLSTGQNPSDLYASILRLDVDGGDPYAIPEDNPVVTDSNFAPEVWAYGLRNPWRFSFDRATGDMYIADVGQNMWEEVDFQEAGSPGGANYGWNSYEASQPFATSKVPENMVYPIAEYPHANGDCSATGGYVYRGSDIPELQGVYLFSDYCTGRVRIAYRDSNGDWQTSLLMDLQRQVSSFGEDQNGELYIVDYSGKVLKFVPAQ